jgi:alpha-tubulin suppressor-like RCC1 family protein
LDRTSSRRTAGGSVALVLLLAMLAPPAGATSVGAGAASVCVVRSDHTLWCWGDNGSGQLGLGNQKPRIKPVRVGTATKWVQASVGDMHTCAVRKDHSLWCWGSNLYGQLGLGTDPSNRLKPVRVGKSTLWRQVAAGSGFTCAVRTDHTLWCWGTNTAGELGLNDYDPRPKPVQVGNETDWGSVTAGTNWTCAVKTDHTLWCWGSNGGWGLLGIGAWGGTYPTAQQVPGTTWKSPSAGYLHTCATKTDGTLWCWGSNDSGELAQTPPTASNAPVQIGAATTWAAVAGGNHSTCATRTNHTLWCWGANGGGQLGVGDQQDRYSPAKVGTATSWTKLDLSSGSCSFAMRSDGTVWAWGLNGGGELGLGDYQMRLKPAKVRFV